MLHCGQNGAVCWCYTLGRVKLLINRESGEAVALKMVDLEQHPEAENSVKKEMLIHKLLKHSNIIKFFGEIFYQI